MARLSRALRGTLRRLEKLRIGPADRSKLGTIGVHPENPIELMAQKNVWAAKVLALLQCRNVSGAVAQIKVAPSVKDLRMLRSALAQTGLAGRWPDAETAIDDNIAAMSAPRLHRSP